MMNIETLLQAAQILESQQSIPPKKRLARGDRQTPANPILTNLASLATINPNPTIISTSPPPPPLLPPPSSLLLRNDSLDPLRRKTSCRKQFFGAEITARDESEGRNAFHQIGFGEEEHNRNGHLVDYPQRDLNLNLHHLNHLAQQQARSSQKQHSKSEHGDMVDDDDDDDDMEQNTDGNSDMSNRGQTTCFRDREIHNRLEKHRRAHLKGCFDNLKAEVPCQRDRKITNLQILNLAIKYIQNLTRRERDYEDEMAVLTARNMELKQQLHTLKADLNSEGHDVDTWLHSCSDLDHSVSTRTASEAEMYRTFADDDDEDAFNASAIDGKLMNGDDDLDNNNNHHGIRTHLNNSYAIDSKILPSSRKPPTQQRLKPSKRRLSSIPTTNLLQTLPISIPARSESVLDYNLARHLHLDQPCNLVTMVKDNLSSTATLTPITDIRYEIVDLFTKGASSHLQQQQQQNSPLPSIASLMNRHSSPIVSPTKQTIGINTDPLTTSTTNILHQSVTTS